ncbi:uncharacterized protein [Amphiura filiformis]|uniref:uncharacterized protein n=1 Tax=Amphiura filiformis TaxID=82378 RepID=UPI003B21337C
MDILIGNFQLDVTAAIKNRDVLKFQNSVWTCVAIWETRSDDSSYLDVLVDALSKNIDACEALISASKKWVKGTARYGNTLLYAASDRGHLEVCRNLVTEWSADVNKLHQSGKTPVYAASENGHVDVCRFLITECEADANIAEQNGKTPLFAASENGHVDVCRVLVTEGKVDVNTPSQTGKTPLYVASLKGHGGVCKFLVTESEAKVNHTQKDQETPLYAASNNGHDEVCRILVIEGEADVNLAAQTGKTPVYAASEKGHVDVCRTLVTDCKADVNIHMQGGATPLYAASSRGYVDVCRVLVSEGEGKVEVNKAQKDGETPLYAASSRGYADVCNFLVTEGEVEVDKAEQTGKTPIYGASENGHVDVCNILVTEGKADVNIVEQDGETPLYAASSRCFEDVCRILFTKGKADVNKAQQDGRTPLHAAVDHQHIATCKMLIAELHADPSQVDKDGKVPIDLWPTNKNILERREFVKSIKISQISALLESGSTPLETIKLFLVGHPGKGKSTLKGSLSTGALKSLFTIRRHDNRIPTPGIKVKEKTIGGAGHFMIWDTAGQIEFHITHAMLLGTGRGIFIAVYSCCDPEEEQKKQLKYWLCFIKACNDPSDDIKPVIQIVGTHVDQSEDVDKALALSKKHYEYLHRIFHEHFCLNEHVILLNSREVRSQPLENLRDALNKLAEPLRGAPIPKICDKIMKQISSWCNSELPLMYFKDFTEKVRQEIDSMVKHETLNLALGYLHDMGQVHHARLGGRKPEGDIIIVHPNWLTTTIFGPVFAPPDFREDFSGLPLKQEYTIDDLKDYFKLKDPNTLLDLLEYFELAYRNDDGTFIIPAKLPDSTDEIAWADNSRTQRYFGLRIECRDESDMFSIDTFPCLQVSAMNRYRTKHVKPKLSRSCVKAVGAVEGMVQQTRDKRAIHIAVRVKEGVAEVKKGINQLQEMESLVFDQITQRSRGTEVSVSYLSPDDLKKSSNLDDGVRFYNDEAVQDAIKNREDLINPSTLDRESVRDVNPSMKNQATDAPDNYAKVCEAVQVLCYVSLPTVQVSVETWHEKQQKLMHPCLATAQCQPCRKPTDKSGACQPCIDWGNAVKNECYPIGKDVEWRNVNASLFHTDPVEVAKGFVFKMPHGLKFTKFGEFDVGGILKLMMSFRYYHKGDQACYNKIEQVLAIRNSLSHMKVEDNMAISDKQLDQYFDTIDDLVTSLEPHQPRLKAKDIRMRLTQIRQSPVTREMKDKWLDENKKGIAEAIWEDDHFKDLKQDVMDIKQDVTDMNQNVTDMKQDMTDLNQDMTDLNLDVTDMKQDVTDIKTILAEQKKGQ